MNGMREITLRINGEEYTAGVTPGETLLNFIREKIDITSPKKGCEIGECGACTVIMNGDAVNSCLIPAEECHGAEILTVEGIGMEGNLHPLQKAFIDHGAVQCGFCTPGMLMSAYALLKDNPDPTEQDIREAIAGNLCRCTGYEPIVKAVMEVSKQKKGVGV